MATLKAYQTSEFAPRRKLRYFQFALLRAARVHYNAANITSAQFLEIEALFKRPWRKSTAAAGLVPWVTVGGSGYLVGNVLTLVKSGGSGGKVIVASINSAGAVRAVLPEAIGTGYIVGRATVTGGAGTGCQIDLMPAVGGVIDILDQVRVDLQTCADAEDWYPSNGIIKDWGDPKAALEWLQDVDGLVGYVGEYDGGTAYVPGQVVVSTGTYYYCKRATTGNACANTTYWVVFPDGGTNNAGQLVGPIGAALAAITGRLAAITSGLI